MKDEQTTLLQFWQQQRELLSAIDRVLEAYEGSTSDQRFLRKAVLKLDEQLKVESILPPDFIDRETGYPYYWSDQCIGDRGLAEDALHQLMVALARVSWDNPWNGRSSKAEVKEAADSYRSAIYHLEQLPTIRQHIYEHAKRMVEFDAELDGDACEEVILGPCESLDPRPERPDVNATIATEELRTKYRDPDNYWRNVWLYEQRKSGKTNPAILAELNERASEFAPIDSDNALRAAIDSIAEFHGWPILKGKPGRPKATGGNAKTLSGNPQTPQ